MLDIMFSVPSRDDVDECVITAETVESGSPKLSIAKKKIKKSDDITKKDFGIIEPSASAS